MANCGECLMKDVEVVELRSNGVCPRCGADYGVPDRGESAKAEAHDHARAGERGDRLRHMANDIVSALMQHGLLTGDARVARVQTFHVLADHVYAGRAVDLPVELGQP